MNPGKLVLLVCALILTNTSFAATFEEEHEAAIAKNPPDVSLHLRFKDGKNVFRQGECIRLEVTPVFRSEVHKIYDLGDFHFPELGLIDHIRTDRPADVVDPLADYLSVAGGNRRFDGPLGEVLTRDTSKLLYVNGWCRFMQPGKYRLYLTTNRLTERSNRLVPPAERVEIASETIELEITPRDAAQDIQDFEKALTILSQPKETRTSQSTYIPWERARMTMQFLETPEAISYLIRRVELGEIETGQRLYTQPNPRTVLTQLERELYAPDHPAGFLMVQALTDLSLMSEKCRGDAARTQAWCSWMTKLSDAVWVKDEAARITGVMALLWWTSTHWQKLKKPTPGDRVIAQRSRLEDEALRLFDSLSVNEQGRVLIAGLIPDDKRLPFLRHLYADARRRADEGSLPKGRDFQDRISTAVYQLFRAAPAEGEAIIANEERNPQPVLTPAALKNVKRWIQRPAEGAAAK